MKLVAIIMTRFIKLLFFLCLTSNVFTQTFSSDVLLLLDSINGQKIKNELSNYDAFFIGETHKSGEVEKTIKTISNFIIDCKPKIKVFFEAPYNFNDFLDTIYVKKDTIYPHGFNALSSDSKQIDMFRYLYLKDITCLKFIDCIPLKHITKWEIISFYKNTENKIVLKDLSILRKISLLKKKKEKKYILFKSNFELHVNEHTRVLGANFNFVQNVLNGVLAEIQSQHDSSSFYFQSSFRENYMFNMLSKEIERDTIPFISLNGHFHITLKQQKSWVNKSNWKSLAAMTKEKYENKKICSVYLLNRNNDYLSDQYFPNEKRLILDNTEPNKLYLIKIDSTNSPIKNLADKFTHILVY